jgi:hypothetical protein
VCGGKTTVQAARLHRHCAPPVLIFLKTHSISMNTIGAEGAIAIGEALKHNKTLREL